MTDIIKLLPESVANQIAAGEVVQRPASVVKELLENAIDAKASAIKLIIKESGKSYIQIVDDGNGMSETDARLCFERHATSKISEANDLYRVTTMGFRGEALASIASVAFVEMKSRRKDDESGTMIIIEGGDLITHEPVACPAGTSIAVKNLFFNIPVRKNFLKSNNVEYKHIVEELIHVALAFPEISFIMSSEKVEVFHLLKGSLRNRVLGIFGKRYDSQIIPINEETPLVKIRGFIGKPEAAKKSRGEQYFFVNKRFIRNPFFNHAVVNAYEGLISNDTFPFYVLFFELPYNKVDVNVHPTKTEVKFEDEKGIYMIIRAAVKKTLGQYQLAPSLDFEHEAFLNNLKLEEKERGKDESKMKVNLGAPSRGDSELRQSSSEKDWKELLKILNSRTDETAADHSISQHELPGITSDTDINEDLSRSDNKIMQVHHKYIFTPIQSGIILIHQQYAHQRILFEEYLQASKNKEMPSQKQIFPEAIEFKEADYQIVCELKPLLEQMGFIIEDFGKRTLLFNGVPVDIKQMNINEFVEELLEEYKSNLGNMPSAPKEILARSMACKLSIKTGDILSKEEMNLLVDKLFACDNPYYSPKGKAVFMKIEKAELDKKFD